MTENDYIRLAAELPDAVAVWLDSERVSVTKGRNNMRKILFLDDDPARQKAVNMSEMGALIYRHKTAIDAMSELECRPGEFDVVCLDHDLQPEKGVYLPSDNLSGYAVAQYIALMPPELRPRKVIIHSYNAEGAARMKAALPDAVIAPFGTPEFWEEVGYPLI